MRYLTVEEIIRINVKILGTKDALRDRRLLESAVARPEASAFGEDAYPTLTEKAAALMHSLVLNHTFVDGNKRTATIALMIFLRLNGLRIVWEQAEALEFITEIAEGKHGVPEIAQWLDI
ncbi:MAG: type II toxin-antitoxin system death-on-curing family toxin, partial [Chloroflexota bacterium]